jgi:hypothetical protein
MADQRKSEEPVAPRPASELDGRVQANERLTALTGIALMVMFVVEIVTVALQPRRVLTLHIVVGLILVPVVALKLVSTSWRLVNYYRGAADYRRKGPPTPLLRALGPILTVLTVAFLLTGFVLILGPHSAYGAALFVHKKIFYFWLVAVVVHLMAHLVRAIRVSYQEVSGAQLLSAPGVRARVGVLTVCVLLGVAVGLILSGDASPYLHAHPVR